MRLWFKDHVAYSFLIGHEHRIHFPSHIILVFSNRRKNERSFKPDNHPILSRCGVITSLLVCTPRRCMRVIPILRGHLLERFDRSAIKDAQCIETWSTFHVFSGGNTWTTLDESHKTILDESHKTILDESTCISMLWIWFRDMICMINHDPCTIHTPYST